MNPKYLQFLYKAYAPVYDLCLRWLFRDGHRKGIECLPKVTPLNVLDVGVGTGLSLSHYRPGDIVTGIDSSPAMLEAARRKESAAKKTDIRLMDASRLAFNDCSFDAVLLFYAVSVFPDPESAISEAVRVSKPGGDIIIVNHSRSTKRWLSRAETLIAPLARLLGFRSDFSIPNCLDRTSGLTKMETRQANAFGYWSVFHYRKNAENESDNSECD